ncbi:MAG: hypothetical protein HS113_15310 [Verrucomicrobiales bacterium]|nr:hypothetical protein [Verrucomicrobiales bacterium]
MSAKVRAAHVLRALALPGARPQPAGVGTAVPTVLQARLPAPTLGGGAGPARHVAESVARGRDPQRIMVARHSTESEAVAYQDLRSAGPPPPPKHPVFALQTQEGSACKLRDLRTGNLRDAGTLYGIFVRMRKDGDVYVSPMSSRDVRGDSHPTLAANTVEGRLGLKTVVAAGELGIIGNELVGHNDKTGHFQTRKNRQQSGLPSEKFYPYTLDSRQWYRAGSA